MSNAAFDRLFECDLQNYQEAKRALNTIEANALKAADECATVLEKVGQAFGKVCKYDELHGILDSWIEKQQLPPTEAVKYLQSAVLIGKESKEDETSKAKAALEKLYSVIGRIYLLLRFGRDYLLGLSEILKLRVTPAMGYLRVQAESVALLKLFADEPHVAQDWLDATASESGKQFYQNHHTKIIKTVKKFNLYENYERGSWMALHSRVGGVSLGIIQGARKLEDSARGTVRLVYQEVDDHVVLFFWFCQYLLFHQKVVGILPTVLPEISSQEFAETGAGKFSEMVDGLRKTLEPLHHDWRKREMPGLVSDI